jgi:hypothetical protein
VAAPLAYRCAELADTAPELERLGRDLLHARARAARSVASSAGEKAEGAPASAPEQQGRGSIWGPVAMLLAYRRVELADAAMELESSIRGHLRASRSGDEVEVRYVAQLRPLLALTARPHLPPPLPLSR